MLFLTNENYYSPEANWDYFSVSFFKEMLECPARAMAGLRGEYKRPQSDAMLIGSYVDAWCEGTLEEFKNAHPEIYNSKKKDEKVLKADFQKADDIIASIENDPVMMSELTGEKQTIMTAFMYGAWWKCKMDCYRPDDAIVDMKIMKSIDDKFWIKDLRRYGGFVEMYKYNLQLNIYAMIEAIATERDNYLTQKIACITKEDPPKKIILTGFEQDMWLTRNYLETYMPYFISVKAGEVDPEGCGKCEYCRGNSPTIQYDYHYLVG